MKDICRFVFLQYFSSLISFDQGFYMIQIKCFSIYPAFCWKVFFYLCFLQVSFKQSSKNVFKRTCRSFAHHSDQEVSSVRSSWIQNVTCITNSFNRNPSLNRNCSCCYREESNIRILSDVSLGKKELRGLFLCFNSVLKDDHVTQKSV